MYKSGIFLKDGKYTALKYPFIVSKKVENIFQKGIDKGNSFCYNNNVRWCGSMAEQLICNQQVVGSTPITSSIMWGNSRAAKGGRL